MFTIGGVTFTTGGGTFNFISGGGIFGHSILTMIGIGGAVLFTIV
jgi:hypothetical protein